MNPPWPWGSHLECTESSAETRFNFCWWLPCLQTAKNSSYPTCVVGKEPTRKQQQQQGIYSPKEIWPQHSGMWLRKKIDAGNPANGPSRRPSSRHGFQSVGIQGLSRPWRVCRPSSAQTPGVSHQSCQQVLAGPRGGIKIRRCKPSQMADYWRGSTLSSHHSSRLSVGCLRRYEMQPIWRSWQHKTDICCHKRAAQCIPAAPGRLASA